MHIKLYIAICNFDDWEADLYNKRVEYFSDSKSEGANTTSTYWTEFGIVQDELNS